MQPDLPDEQLMQRIAQNDTTAFDLLFRRHGWSITLRMVGLIAGAGILIGRGFHRGSLPETSPPCKR
jgi:hypothetical protein